jgi:hypothetical protein
MTRKKNTQTRKVQIQRVGADFESRLVLLDHEIEHCGGFVRWGEGRTETAGKVGGR